MFNFKPGSDVHGGFSSSSVQQIIVNTVSSYDSTQWKLVIAKAERLYSSEWSYRKTIKANSEHVVFVSLQ